MYWLAVLCKIEALAKAALQICLQTTHQLFFCQLCDTRLLLLLEIPSWVTLAVLMWALVSSTADENVRKFHYYCFCCESRYKPRAWRCLEWLQERRSFTSPPHWEIWTKRPRSSWKRPAPGSKTGLHIKHRLFCPFYPQMWTGLGLWTYLSSAEQFLS